MSALSNHSPHDSRWAAHGGGVAIGDPSRYELYYEGLEQSDQMGWLTVRCSEEVVYKVVVWEAKEATGVDDERVEPE